MSNLDPGKAQNALLMVLVLSQAFHVAVGEKCLPKGLFMASDLAKLHLRLQEFKFRIA
jgi:hypothetical protein